MTNREQLERLYLEYGRGDLSREDIFDPGVESASFGVLQTKPMRGIEEVRRGMAEWLSSWQKPATLHAERFFGEGDRFCVFIRWRGRGKGSGTPFDAEGAHIWEFRDRRAVRFDVYRDREEALAAFERG